MKFYVRPNMDIKIKTIWAVLTLLFCAWRYYSANDGSNYGGRYYLGSQGIEDRYYVVALFIGIILFGLYFSLTRYVILKNNEIKICISIASYTIKITDITKIHVKGKNIFITYDEGCLSEELCLRPKNFKLFLQELYEKAPHLR